jgi:hypothetical protein
MVRVIRQAINMYKKANGITNARRSDYPEILNNLFGINIPLRALEGMSAVELMDILVKKEV